jgi:peptidoglycan/xylan/chitin deacetylase (PgdA/CDA1 family)
VVLVGVVLAGALALPPVDELPTPQRLMYEAKPVYCANPRGRNLALTFDDGPSPYTLRLARVLRREHARATFFLVGSRVGVWPDAARAAARVGALGNHTWSHAHLLRLSPSGVRAELVQTQRIIGRTVGTVPRVFRPPYEEASVADDRIARSLGLLDIRWSVDARDSHAGARPRAIVRTLKPLLRPGAIVLLHDLHPWTPAVARALIREARRRGLRLVTVPDLLARQPPTKRQLSSTGASRCPA